jgi:hypothetical protein
MTPQSLLKRGGYVANVRLDLGCELLEFCALFSEISASARTSSTKAKPRQ